MILFFQSSTKTVLAVEAAHAFSPEDTQKLVWLFSEATPVQSETLEGWYVGFLSLSAQTEETHQKYQNEICFSHCYISY